MNEELKKALLCLRLEVNESIANDVETKAIRAIAEAREEGIDEMRGEMHRIHPASLRGIDDAAERLKDKG